MSCRYQQLVLHASPAKVVGPRWWSWRLFATVTARARPCTAANRANAWLPGAVNANPAWVQHLQDTADVAEASLDDLDWADVVLFGTPTRFGTPASQLKAFIDTTGGRWQQGQTGRQSV